MSKIKALLSWEPTDLELEAVQRSFPSDCEIIVPQDWSEQGLVKLVEDIDIIVGRVRGPMLKAIKAAKKLKLIHATGHGVDFILKDNIRETLIKRNISVVKSNPSAINISEFVIMCMVALSRRVFKLHEALKSGKLAGAAVDVWESEEEKARLSQYPIDRPIHQYNVIMTPHYSGLTKENRLRAMTIAGENIKRLMSGEPLKNLADLSKGY